MDLLSKAEFEAGFGSHTPIYTGQTKCSPAFRNTMLRLCALFTLVVDARADARSRSMLVLSPSQPHEDPLQEGRFASSGGPHQSRGCGSGLGLLPLRLALPLVQLLNS